MNKRRKNNTSPSIGEVNNLTVSKRKCSSSPIFSDCHDSCKIQKENKENKILNDKEITELPKDTIFYFKKYKNDTFTYETNNNEEYSFQIYEKFKVNYTIEPVMTINNILLIKKF